MGQNIYCSKLHTVHFSHLLQKSWVFGDEALACINQSLKKIHFVRNLHHFLLNLDRVYKFIFSSTFFTFS